MVDRNNSSRAVIVPKKTLREVLKATRKCFSAIVPKKTLREVLKATRKCFLRYDDSLGGKMAADPFLHFVS
jgi:nitrogen fixation protein